ncbi:hypothetical protein C8Q69DRAFT_478111 [Paecilomyces variotii]|uniref:Uncharacterized protein n=1 Tax=Byssochlamys spectabilis TaxID=264951 RepID=A0A443HLJ9_BYSSP|nr:hypothetical protein C8Q69DRAFT_478111 [Paecilomyces variotii]RWQ92691.1 hypothetical protein C8Q69DRAFT_478111 [Paecilomyces variotii]
MQSPMAVVRWQGPTHVVMIIAFLRIFLPLFVGISFLVILPFVVGHFLVYPQLPGCLGLFHVHLFSVWLRRCLSHASIAILLLHTLFGYPSPNRLSFLRGVPGVYCPCASFSDSFC